MAMVLSEMVPGDSGSVVEMTAAGSLGQRLMDLGFYPGAIIRVIRNAPLKDPLEIELDGYHLSLRHEEAGHVEVAPR